MQVGIASDLNNPNFAGPINPDTLLSVEFFMHEPLDANKSQEAGMAVRGPAIPYVRIQAPSDHTSIIETAVREEHKRRFPDKWLYFQIQNNMVEGAAEIPGWKIEEWTEVTPEQVRTLQFMRFSVVEQVANASDGQCQRMGMDGMSLREKARLALRARMGVEIKQEMEAKDAEIALLKEKMARFEAFMASAEKPAPLGLPKEKRG